MRNDNMKVYFIKNEVDIGKKIAMMFVLMTLNSVVYSKTADLPKEQIVISKEVLKDKIKGAWAAQTIGVTFGAPIEFMYNTTFVQDNQRIDWNDSSLFVEFRDRPGTYDDIYMDLTFMKVIEDHGADASAQTFAHAFASADYKLWFANQTARYNIQNGLEPPMSGYWTNNPCADDIDFQIEADFAGIMSPGLTNTAVDICDRVGHIMNYGDGWYGGVFVASLYSRALITNNLDDLERIIKEALNVIPAESKLFQCLDDVIKWYKENPDDWKLTWFKTSRKWGVDTSSPSGVFQPFNIDAKINAAWVVLGLLYGNGDFARTLEISTRCGDDADCNPSTAGGVLGAIMGYKAIPEYWKKGLKKVEEIPFKGTTISLLDAYNMSYKHAENLIARNGGEVRDLDLVIKTQNPKTVPLEVSFEGHYPIDKIKPKETADEISFDFDGIGFAAVGQANQRNGKGHVFESEMYIDGKMIEKAKIPTIENERRFTPFYRYQLKEGNHHVVIKILNPVDDARFNVDYVIVYGKKPYKVGL
jgi:hypothetical protein